LKLIKIGKAVDTKKYLQLFYLGWRCYNEDYGKIIFLGGKNEY